MEGAVELKEELEGEILFLRIKGRLDAISSPAAEKKILDLITNGQHHILLDFSEVDYLSSAGMRLLLRTSKKLKSVSGKLIVCAVSPNVMDVLRMSGFDHVIELAPSKEEALRLF